MKTQCILRGRIGLLGSRLLSYLQRVRDKILRCDKINRSVITNITTDMWKLHGPTHLLRFFHSKGVVKASGAWYANSFDIDQVYNILQREWGKSEAIIERAEMMMERMPEGLGMDNIGITRLRHAVTGKALLSGSSSDSSGHQSMSVRVSRVLSHLI